MSSSMSMSMSMASSTATSSSAASSASSTMSSMDSMDMDSTSCSMSMLGNWETIDSCFLTSSWHIKTIAQFAGSCVGVFLLVMLLEGIRRWGREYDRYIFRKAAISRQESSGVGGGSLSKQSTNDEKIAARQADLEDRLGSLPSTSASSSALPAGAEMLDRLERVFYGNATANAQLGSAIWRPTKIQQLIRSLTYATQFTGAYIVMLIAMSFNGYMLISITLGALAGHYVATWDNVTFEQDTLAAAAAATATGSVVAGTARLAYPTMEKKTATSAWPIRPVQAVTEEPKRKSCCRSKA